MKRRQFINAVVGAGTGLVAAPVINRGRYRIFAGSSFEYSARTIDLMGRSVVIDMLSPLTLSNDVLLQRLRDPESFTRDDWQRYRDARGEGEAGFAAAQAPVFLHNLGCLADRSSGCRLR